MAEITTTGIAAHGSNRLPSVEIDNFNIELKDEEGFLGDRASKGAFREILEKWRKPLRSTGKDPFGEVASEDISKKQLDSMLAGDEPEAAAVGCGPTVSRSTRRRPSIRPSTAAFPGWRSDALAARPPALCGIPASA